MKSNGQVSLEYLLAIGLALIIAIFTLETGDSMKDQQTQIRAIQKNQETGLGCCELINHALAGGVSDAITLPGNCSIEKSFVTIENKRICPLLPGPVGINPQTNAIEIQDY
jgi:hypothetical protein